MDLIALLRRGQRSPDEAMRVLAEIERMCASGDEGVLAAFGIASGLWGARAPSPELVQRLESSALGGVFSFVRPTKVLRKESEAMAPGGTDSVAIQFQANEGWVIGLSGCVRDATSAAELDGSLVTAQVAWDGSERRLVTDGQTDTEISYCSLFNKSFPYLPFLRWVSHSQTANINWTNRSNASTVRAEIAFWMITYRC